jgi:hypothetical protein
MLMLRAASVILSAELPFCLGPRTRTQACMDTGTICNVTIRGSRGEEVLIFLASSQEVPLLSRPLAAASCSAPSCSLHMTLTRFYEGLPLLVLGTGGGKAWQPLILGYCRISVFCTYTFETICSLDLD